MNGWIISKSAFL